MVKIHWLIVLVIFIAGIAGGILVWQYGKIGKEFAPTNVEITGDEAIKLIKNFPEVREWLSTFTEQCDIFPGKPCKIIKTVEGLDSGVRCTPEIKIDHIHIKGKHYVVHAYEVCKSKDGKQEFIAELGENKGWYKVHINTGEVTLKRPLEEEIENWKTYRNEKYGFEFKYPKEYDECEPCKLKESENLIEIGEGRFSIEIINSGGLSLIDYVNKFVNEEKKLGVLPENISVGEISVGGNEGFAVSFSGSRPASYIFLSKDNKIYQISWGALGVTGCLGYYKECKADVPSELEIFEQIPFTFQFLK